MRVAIRTKVDEDYYTDSSAGIRFCGFKTLKTDQGLDHVGI